MRSKIAVLIPCYNESKTIEKIIKRVYLMLIYMSMIIILQMAQMKLQEKPEQ